MEGHQEIVFQVQAVGGNLAIERQHESSGDFFFIRENHSGPSILGADTHWQQPCESFRKAFQHISTHYAWYLQLLMVVHDDYRQEVVDELMFRLNRFSVEPTQISRIMTSYREQLHIQVEYGPVALSNGLQRICVTNLMKLTEYDYHEFTDHYAREIGQKFRVKGTYELWTEDQQYNYNHNEIIRRKHAFEVVGRLEVDNGTVVIRDEFGAILYVFSADKYLVHTSPVLGRTSRWHYRTL